MRASCGEPSGQPRHRLRMNRAARSARSARTTTPDVGGLESRGELMGGRFHSRSAVVSAICGPISSGCSRCASLDREVVGTAEGAPIGASMGVSRVEMAAARARPVVAVADSTVDLRANFFLKSA